LGGHLCTLRLSATQVAVPPPASPELADVGAWVTVAGTKGPPATHDTPEPSTLTLTGLALAAVGARAWRRRAAEARGAPS
jgi:hypothetical protein